MYEFYFPQCSHPILFVNKKAISLLRDGGTLVFFGKFMEVPNIADKPLKPYIKYAASLMKDDRDKIKDAFVISQDGLKSEYFFQLVSCGKCSLCGQRKQLDMVNRASFESTLYDCPPYFFTLTYDNDHLPPYGELRYTDVQKFFKRLRKKWDSQHISHNIRYIVAGEYGSKYGRPHYHCILFNNPYKANELRPILHSRLAKDIFESWGMCQLSGFDFGECAGGAAAYATKYLAKQCDAKGHFVKPFVRTSIKNGGIGSAFIDKKVKYLHDNPSLSKISYMIDDKLKEINFGRYVSNRVYPSKSRLIPAVIRSAFIQLNQLYTYMVAYGFKSYEDALNVLRLLRPCDESFISFNQFQVNAVDIHKTCWLSRSRMLHMFSLTEVSLMDTLAEVIEIPVEYLTQLDAHRSSALPQKIDNDLSARYSKANMKIADSKNREIF